MAGTDFGVNFGAGIAVNLISAIGRQARYCYQFNSLVTDLDDEQRNLVSTRDSLQVQVRKYKVNSKEPSEDLQEQLRAANDLVNRVQELKEKAGTSQSCCHGICPNWICRYIVGKKAEEKTKAMKQLNKSLRLKLLSAHRLSLRPMLPSEGFILFKCTEEARIKILMALTNDEKIRIGLSGMGGCGKSSLLRQVHKEMVDSKLYKTAFAVVSNPPNYQAIQDSIANWLGLVFETEKNVPDRAARLSMAFEEEKKYLIILDDVWEVLDFKMIGIPFSKNCKVLLSTRQQHIFELMDCKEVIYLSLLTNDEAWQLFQKHAGEIKDSFQQVAREISDECYRLPVAIKAVASTLKGKPPFVWKEALATLKDRRQPLNIEKGLEDPYRCLKFSFDELKDAEEVSLFLLCALFPKDSEIALEILIRFAFGLGIFLGIDSYQRARSKVCTAIDKFKNHCLLLQEGQSIKLHDMLHTLALWEAKNKTQVIIGPRKIQALIGEDYMKDITRLYSQDINEFPSQLNCPELEILLVSNNSGCSSKFPDTFFKEMIKLKVLMIKNASVGTNPNLLLPHSVERLKKLRTLCLGGWTLDNIYSFGELNILYTIELSDCIMKELPKELAKLRELKLLHISSCRIGGNPYQVLATCLELEELYFVENHLTEMVGIDQNVAELFQQIGSSKVLQRYHLEIGSSIHTSRDGSLSKFISINNSNAFISNEAIQVLPQTLEVLSLGKIQGDWKSIIPNMIPMEGNCVNELQEFVVLDSDNIKCLIDTTNDELYQDGIIFSKLQKLRIEAMECLEALCHGPPPSGLFEKLKKLFITKCSQLASLFTTPTAEKMVMLEVLKVTYCFKLKHIIEVEKDDNISPAPLFPNLQQISVKGCDHLECIIPISFASGLSQLENLEIEDAAVLKHVFGNRDIGEDQNQNQSIDLPVLKVFKLINLPNITSICPQNYHITYPLDKPHAMGCPQMSGISDLDSETRLQGGDKATKQAELLTMSSVEDIGFNVENQIAKDLALAATGKAQFNILVTDLATEKSKLIVQIREAEANIAEPSRDLQQQLEEAKDLIEKVEKLERKAKASQSYCPWVFPNWICQHIVGKRLARKIKAIKQLSERFASNLLFANHRLLQPMVRGSCSANFIFFESRKKMHDEILMALKDDITNMIGLCGMGGCGKTSLALEMCKVVEHLKLFDMVIFVKVPRHRSDVVQDKIARSLGLIFNSNENELERAAKLSMRLNNGDKFLIVLDDMWEVIKLKDTGIPRGRNCKLILTTRLRSVCTMMDCQSEIYLSILSEEEAWILFEAHAVVIGEAFEIFARQVLEECQGLPIAIIAMARYLKNKPAVVWIEALTKLRDHALDIEIDVRSTTKCLELSIENLEDSKVLSLFLLCALFPEDSNITLESLIKFAFGLSIFEDVDSYEGARSKVVAAIDKLQDSSLLQLTKEGQYLQMHGLVHDVVLMVAQKTCVIIEEDLEALTERNFRDYTRLCCHDIYEFPFQLNFPKLEILFVSNDGGFSPRFSNAFFEEMIELKVLAIIDTSIWRTPNLLLPRSIEGLKKLRTLCLRGWTLGNISVLGKLEMLDTIEILYCVIKELPEELAKLSKLKLLEVSRSTIGGNPFEVLARCSQLEELYFVKNYLQDMGLNDRNVVELLHWIGSSKVLRRCHLEIGGSIDNWKDEIGSSIDKWKDDVKSKVISINNFNASTLNEAIKDLAQKLEVLSLGKIQGDCKNIIPDMIPTDGECVDELIKFLLCDSDSIECLIDTTNCQLYQARTIFSKLLKLKVKTMKSMEALCRGPPPSGLFKKLEELFLMECSQLHCLVSVGELNLCSLKCLQLEDCPNLTFVFTYSTAQSTVLLEVLEVRGCTALKHIIKDEKEKDDIISAGPVFPKLKQVSVQRCEHLECIIPASFAGGLSQLESLEIEDASKLKHVFGKYSHEEDQDPEQSIDLPVLKVFKLILLPNIISICPQNYHITWPSLDRPHIRRCPQLKSMSDLDSEMRKQGDDKAEKEELVLPTISMESYSKPEGLRQEFERSEDEGEAIATMEQERYHDDASKDEDEREEKQHKEEEYAIPEDSSSLIEQITTSYVESREVDEVMVGNPSVGNYSLPSTSASCMSKVDEIHQDKEVPSHIALTYTNEDSNFHLQKQDGTSDLHYEVQAVVEVHHPSEELDKSVDTQEGLQKQNFCPVGSMTLRESCTEIEKGSHHKDPAPEELKVGNSSQELIDKKLQALEEYKEEAAAAAEEHLHHGNGEDKDGREEKQQTKEEELEVQEDSSTVIQQSTTSWVENREADVGNYSIPSPAASKEGSGTSTIQDDNLNEENQRSNNDIDGGFNLIKATGSNFHPMKQDGISAPHQQMLPEDSHNAAQGPAEVVATQESLQERHFYPVGPMNSRESNTEIAKGSLDRDHALEESKLGTSSQELIKKQPQFELELPQSVADPQQAPEKYKVLSPSTSITTTSPAIEPPASSSANQQPSAKEWVDFRGLFKMKAGRVHLLEVSFVKYPHLWEWKRSQKTLGLCKVGYKFLADMLAFLNSETPKAMDDSKSKDLEDLYVELEHFGFDKEWLASIRERVNDMQVNHNDKLKQRDHLKSQISTLEKQLSDARASLATMEDDLSKPGNVFGF